MGKNGAGGGGQGLKKAIKEGTLTKWAKDRLRKQKQKKKEEQDKFEQDVKWYQFLRSLNKPGQQRTVVRQNRDTGKWEVWDTR